MSDLLAERVRVRSGSIGGAYQSWTISTYNGSDPNGVRAEPSGSLLRDQRGRIWINVDNGTSWGLWGGNTQVWTQTATGLEGTDLSAVLPAPFPDTNYQAMVTNFSGTYSPAFKVINKTATGFTVVSTAPFLSGDKLDLLAISGGLGATIDGQFLTNLSGTLNSAIANLSGTVATAIASSFSNSDWKNAPENDPSAPDSLDDEFNGSVLDSKWVAFNASSLTSSVANSTLVMTRSAGNNLSGYVQSFSPGSSDFTFEIKIDMAGVSRASSTFPASGIVLTDGTKYLLGGFFGNSATQQLSLHRWATLNSFSANTLTSTITLPTYSSFVTNGWTYPLPLWLRFQRSGTSVIMSWSANGYDWTSSTVASEISYLSTITGVGIGSQNNQGAGTATISPRYFYFRKIA